MKWRPAMTWTVDPMHNSGGVFRRGYDRRRYAEHTRRAARQPLEVTRLPGRRTLPDYRLQEHRIEHAAHDQYTMTGDLTIRDVTRPVSLDVVYSGQAKDLMGNLPPDSAPTRPSTAKIGG